jgi:hypothetical protein
MARVATLNQHRADLPLKESNIIGVDFLGQDRRSAHEQEQRRKEEEARHEEAPRFMTPTLENGAGRQDGIRLKHLPSITHAAKDSPAAEVLQPNPT